MDYAVPLRSPSPNLSHIKPFPSNYFSSRSFSNSSTSSLIYPQTPQTNIPDGVVKLWELATLSRFSNWPQWDLKHTLNHINTPAHTHPSTTHTHTHTSQNLHTSLRIICCWALSTFGDLENSSLVVSSGYKIALLDDAFESIRIVPEDFHHRSVWEQLI